MSSHEKRKRPLSSDKRKTIWRSGVFSAAQPKWLTTRGVGRWSLDNKKSDGTRLALTSIRRICVVALATQLIWLMTRRAGSPESGHRKAETAAQLRQA
ncbi:hypothetical protein CXF70_03785 [Planomicrobium sp. MB-3u-38]|nr:hypothetical protein CXF70_03785 [Planomicrobium sp. MB-3u-38]